MACSESGEMAEGYIPPDMREGEEWEAVSVRTLRRGTADSRLTPQPVKAVRVRATADQGPNWLMVREFILESAGKNSLQTTDPIGPLQIADGNTGLRQRWPRLCFLDWGRF